MQRALLRCTLLPVPVHTCVTCLGMQSRVLTNTGTLCGSATAPPQTVPHHSKTRSLHSRSRLANVKALQTTSSTDQHTRCGAQVPGPRLKPGSEPKPALGTPLPGAAASAAAAPALRPGLEAAAGAAARLLQLLCEAAPGQAARAAPAAWAAFWAIASCAPACRRPCTPSPVGARVHCRLLRLIVLD